jgi:Spy/CpxP family protein refolding chaperone
MTISNFSRLTRYSLSLLALLAMGTTAFAQQPSRAEQNPRRELLEQRLRERTGQIVQRRLELNDAQMRQLQTTNRQFEKQRSDLIAREREMRRELRAQMLAEKPDQNRVSQLLDQSLMLERQRLDLVQSEQRELAKFLNPVQRAKLFAFQTELRWRSQELRNRPRNRNLPPGRPLRFNP